MQERTPMRTCIGCGQERPKGAFVRILRTPTGEIVLDATGKANGRGAYLCPDPACLQRAEKRRALSRALHTEVPHAIYESLAERLENGGAHAE